MPYSKFTEWFENPTPAIRREARNMRKQGYWAYLKTKPLRQWTPRECAEVFARYIHWSPDEILGLSADELIALIDILEEDPRDLSPLKFHQRYIKADEVSLTVGAIVRAHDARRSGERR